MEDLLRNDFTFHYGLSVCTTTNLIVVTNELYFEIEDTDAKEIILHTARGRGIANFSNPNKMLITVANYDKFVSNLAPSFQEGKKRCDVLVTCDRNRYFVLGELKDRNISTVRSRHNVKRDAKKQLFQSLRTLTDVPEILDYINSKSIRRCCYFNKQAKSPSIINAISAFNRLANVFPDGFKMTHSDIEALNFEFWEYTGEQTLTMTA
jgi:hypothetical protein